jgi:hypothetical protein
MGLNPANVYDNVQAQAGNSSSDESSSAGEDEWDSDELSQSEEDMVANAIRMSHVNNQFATQDKLTQFFYANNGIKLNGEKQLDDKYGAPYRKAIDSVKEEKLNTLLGYPVSGLVAIAGVTLSVLAGIYVVNELFTDAAKDFGVCEQNDSGKRRKRSARYFSRYEEQSGMVPGL